MGIRFENTVTPSADQWKAAIMGARNPMNSWEKSDSAECRDFHCGEGGCYDGIKPDDFIIGPNDLNLLKRLCSAGTDHRKFMRMLPVMVTITAPLYWWKEFSTYKVGTVANSCSTMHKIAEKEFTRDEFSCEHLLPRTLDILDECIMELNIWREIYLNGYPAENGYNEIKPKDKEVWWQMIQLLPSSYNQKRTVMMNYEVLANIYKSRKNHKLDEWAEHKAEMIDVTTSENLVNGDHRPHLVEGVKEYFGFCDWIKTLPYSELITGKEA